MEHGHGHAVGVVYKLEGIIAHGHLPELAAVIHIAVGVTSVTAAGPHSVGVVGVGPGGPGLAHGGQLPAVLPGVGPGAIRQGVANSIVGNGVAVIGGKQVPPVAVPIAVGMAFTRRGNLPSGDLAFGAAPSPKKVKACT